MGTGTTLGLVGINTAAPTAYLDAYAGTSTTVNAVYGHSFNVGGYLGYDNPYSFGVANDGSGFQTISGAGVWAANPKANYSSFYAQSTGSANVAASITYSNVWIAEYAKVDNSSGTLDPSALYGELNVTNKSLSGTQAAVVGVSSHYATSNIGETVGGIFQALGNNQQSYGVVGEGISNAPDLGTSNTSYSSFGGYFVGIDTFGFGSAVWVGGMQEGLTYKIIGNGSVNELISTPDHGRIVLTCPESPEYWYTDYGNTELKNGRAHIKLDPILKDVCFINAENPMKVICQAGYEDCKGLAVINKTSDGFDIVELNNGKGNGPVDYEIIVKPKTNYGAGRFYQGPRPPWLPADKDPAAAKAANQIAGKQIFHWEPDYKVYGYIPEDVIPVGDRIPIGPHAGKIKLGNGKYGDGVPAKNPDNSAGNK
jgi:hypothetical protein